MRNYYRVEFFRISFNKETQTQGMELLGTIEINDDCVTRDLPLAAKAALRAPHGCQMFDKLRFTKL